MEKKDLTSIKNILLSKKTELEVRLKKIELNKTRAAGPLNANSTEQAVELQNKDVVDALDNIEHKQLEEIETALTLIENGTYGTCVSCSEEISAARLGAMPSAKLCITCAKEQ